jgi:two-component system, LuxR family, response regulator FixJ
MSNQRSGEIFIADDDPSVRDVLSLIFAVEGYQVTSFGEGTSLLSAARSRVPTCILLDVEMPGRSGLDILKELNAQDYPAPILIISGKSNTSMVVDAIRNGALDFIEKPFDPDTVAVRVREAVEASARCSGTRTASDILMHQFRGRDQLTRRECEVLARIAAGASNKEAGRHLGISSRTIEVHRARVMEKLGARNAADLVRIVFSEDRRH